MNKLYEYYHARAIAYGRTFGGEKNPLAEIILEDLAKFCRANETTFHPDARVSAVLEGRREVWLRVQEFMTLNAEQLLEKYTKNPTPNTEDHTK
jgi:hypothetical protein